MRVLIAADMEGISCVTRWEHVDPGHAEYQRFRSIMTDEVNAAIDGALDGGATSILVTDGHNAGRNVLIEKLRAPAHLISGSPAPLSMVEGVQNSDVAFFIGYHAMAGTAGAILCHTWTDQVRGVWLNDRAVGEIGLNAAVCGSFNVPIGLVTGDVAATQEALDLLGPIETVAVKRAVSRMAAECYPIEENHRAIRLAATRAVRAAHAPWRVDAPITLVVELSRPDQIDRAMRMPGTVRVSGTKLQWTGADMREVYRAFRAIAGLGD
jgi:D-amino peptidase